MSKSLTIIYSPYHVGIADHRVGRGPTRLLPLLQKQLSSNGYAHLEIDCIHPVDDFEGEIGRSFELLRRHSTAVAKALRSGRFPVVLAGNCHTSVGIAAGLAASGKVDMETLDVFWADAHADLQTPDDNTSGYLDSMGCATLAGMCWQALAATVEGHKAFDLHKVTFIGARDIEPAEE